MKPIILPPGMGAMSEYTELFSLHSSTSLGKEKIIFIQIC